MIEQNPIMPDRRYWNILKGIGILCVVLGHACSWAHNFVYEFHIPLFFFISGFMYSEKKYGDDPYLNVINRFKSSWIKYVIIYWIIMLLHNSLIRWGFMPIGTEYFNLRTLAEACAFVVLGTANELMGGTLWFVPALCMASVFLGFLVTISRKILSQICFSVCSHPVMFSCWMHCHIYFNACQYSGIAYGHAIFVDRLSDQKLWQGIRKVPVCLCGDNLGASYLFYSFSSLFRSDLWYLIPRNVSGGVFRHICVYGSGKISQPSKKDRIFCSVLWKGIFLDHDSALSANQDHRSYLGGVYRRPGSGTVSGFATFF